MISVIIPAYNAAKTLPSCLTALRSQTVAVDEFEVIVVDDGSKDNTAQLARKAGVRLISQANAGAASARNHGAQVAGGALLLFTDADCVPAQDWVAQMSAPFSDPNVAGAKGVYRTDQSQLTARFVQLEYQDKYDRMLNLDSIDFVDTYSAAYRRDIFLQMGGFDPTFPGASVEDQEFSFRLAEAGYRLVFLPEAKVWHTHDRTVGEYARRKYFIGYWKNLVVRRYPTKLVRDSHTPQVLKAQMGLAALGGGFLGIGCLLGILKGAGGVMVSLWGVFSWGALLLSGLSFYKKIAQQDRAVLLIAPVLIFIRAWALGLGFLCGYLYLVLTRQLKSNAL